MSAEQVDGDDWVILEYDTAEAGVFWQAFRLHDGLAVMIRPGQQWEGQYVAWLSAPADEHDWPQCHADTIQDAVLLAIS